MKPRELLKTSGLAILGLLLSSALCFAVGKGVFYYNYNIAPPAKLMKQIKYGQPYQEVYLLFNQYREKYNNDNAVSVDEGITDQLTVDALKIPLGKKYLHIYHWIFMDDLQLTVYFDNNDRVVRISYIGD